MQYAVAFLEGIITFIYFLLALVKNQEIVDQIQEPSFIEHSKQARVQLVWDRITNLLRFKSAHLLVMNKRSVTTYYTMARKESNKNNSEPGNLSRVHCCGSILRR